jgi:hypothetical protein
MATHHTPMRIKIDGTDLLRANGLLAPEFILSNYESPAFPIERCTIYDAGSRAFDVVEYLADVTEYWEKCAELATSGVTFQELLKERFPELESSRFDGVTLSEVVAEQLRKARTVFS